MIKLFLKPYLLMGKYIFCTLLLAGHFGCDDDTSQANTAGSEMAGETTAGETTAGDTTAGEQLPHEARSIIESVTERRRLVLPGLQAPVEVIFTEGMVPNIYAENDTDLGITLGYLLARDRFFNMDLLRRLAQGRVSELFGEAGLQNDQESLDLGMRLVTQRLASRVSPRVKAYLEAVVRGINAYVDAAKSGDEAIPSELELAARFFAVQPTELMSPWTFEDVVSMATVILYETNFEDKDIDATARLKRLETAYGEDEERRQAFIQDVALNMKPPVEGNSSLPPSSWGQSVDKQELDKQVPSLRAEQQQLTPQSPLLKSLSVKRLVDLSSRLARRHGFFGHDPEEGFGSNAWAAGRATTDTGAIISGDGHLQLSVPSIMYQIGLNTETLGGGDIHQKGLLITSIPVMAVGTNGHVAWSQVNPNVDITDWYVEQLKLDDQGLPESSLYQGEWQPLIKTTETVYVAGRALLGSEERTVTWTTYSTFDGRRIVEIEGRQLSDDEEPSAGEGVVSLLGDRFALDPSQNGGIVSAISFDHTALDASHFIDSLFSLGLAQDLSEFEHETKKLIGGGLFSAAGDREGNILYTSYQSVPCRGYLERDDQGFFRPGQSPMTLLDGTQIKGFQLLSDDEGVIIEDRNDDPYSCVIPYDEMPISRNPDVGYLSTANNDPLGFADDGRVDNDRWYIGGPWTPFRQHTILRGLSGAAQSGDITVESMRRLHADVTSPMGELFAPFFISALNTIELWSQSETTDPSSEHAVSLFLENRERLSEAKSRLEDWQTTGFRAESGVETFYNEVDDQERANAVATSIFNAAFRQLLREVWSDEEEGAIPFDGTRMKVYALHRILNGRGADNPSGLSSWRADFNESLFFDRLETEAIERSEELMIRSLITGLDELSAASEGPGQGGFGTDVMDQWLWGLHHMARFESLLAPFLGGAGPLGAILDGFAITTSVLPLADDLAENDPRSDLKWFPRPGDQWNIDAGNAGFGGGYSYGNGAVMRMTIQLTEDRVSGYNIIPGGQSGIKDDPHATDQLKLWLSNQAYPLRFHLDEIVDGATQRWRFTPEVTE